jgi:hypothetical protein
LFIKQGKIEALFTDATFSFTDGLLEDVQKMLNWRASAAGSMDLYVSRQKERQELTGLRASPLGKVRCLSPSQDLVTTRFTATKPVPWLSMCMRIESQTK